MKTVIALSGALALLGFAALAAADKGDKQAGAGKPDAASSGNAK